MRKLHAYMRWAISGLVSFFLALGFVNSLEAQEVDTSYQLYTRIEGAFRFFTTDKLSQVYAVTPTNEVIKYSPEGQELFRFNNNTLGDLGLIDATNPFSLILFYPNYQTVITLDRTLNVINEVSLLNLDPNSFWGDVRVLGASNDNNFWLYDEFNFQLKKVDRRGNVLNASENLNLLLGAPPQPAYIEARENFVYLNTSNLGLLVFDNFGQYHKSLPLNEVIYFQVLDNRLIFLQKQQLQAYNMNTLITSVLKLPPNARPEEQTRFQKNRCYILREDALEIYRF